MTVLRFIDARFRPAVVVSDAEVQRYYESHRAEFKGSLDDARQSITDQLSAERVNALLEDWLKEQRKQARIEYLEKSLQ
jgi:parvulin-like peptidyl-prolyl isomerase